MSTRICTNERYTLRIDGTELPYIRIHFIKSHPSPDPDTFDINLTPAIGQLVNYFDSVEIRKDGVTDFYGFIEEIIPKVSEDGFEYKILGRCWKLICWKKYSERFVETREIGPAGESGFFGSVYPHELLQFLLRVPISTHPADYPRHKIGWGIPSDSWKCAARRTATGHHAVWAATRMAGFAWQLGGTDYVGETLVCNGWTNTQNQWAKHGAPPYLDDDDIINYIEADNFGDVDQYYTFADLNADYREGTVASCVLWLKGRFVDDGGSVGGDTVIVRVYVYTGSAYGTGLQGTVNFTWTGLEVAWTLKSNDISAWITTIEEANNLHIAVDWFAATNPANQHPEVTYAYLVVSASESDYQRDGDWFAIDLGAAYAGIVGILIESRDDITETQFARHFAVEYNTVAFTANTPPVAGWNVIRYITWNFARDIILSWIPLDGINARCIRIRITEDADFGWEISQIYIWQTDDSKYRLINE